MSAGLTRVTESCQLRAWTCGSSWPPSSSSPRHARGELNRKAERSVRVADAGLVRERTDHAAPDEVVVPVVGLEPVWPQPRRVQVGASLPLLEAHLEQVREVTFEGDLEEQREWRAPVRVQDEVLVEAVGAEQPVNGDRDARPTHVARRPGNVVRDEMPARVPV